MDRTSMTSRSLVVTGDDFGQSMGTTDGIVEAHARGVVTGASLMVRYDAAPAAAAYAAAHPGLAAGLHLDLGEWMWSDGAWTPLYEIVRLEDAAEVEEEAWKQVELFRTLLKRDPSHLDSHQHVHRREPVRSVLLDMAAKLDVPLRECTPGIRYCGAFYGQTLVGSPHVEAIGVDALLELLAGLPPGTTELGCHPATDDDTRGMYRSERRLELRTLCDPRARDALRREDISVRSFRDFQWR